MYGSISAKIAFGWTEAESVIACVASVSVWFRRKERGTRDKDRAKNGARGEGVGKTFPSFPSPTHSFIFWLSFHFSHSQNRKSRSSVFLCFENYRKRMLRSLNPQRKISRIQKYPDTYGQCPRIVLTDNIQSGGNCSVYYYYWQGITEARCQIIILPIPGVIIRVWRSHTLFVEKHPMLY